MATEMKDPPKRVRLDPQDPLPESRWLFRRILMFGFAALLVVSIAWTTILIAKLAFNAPSATPTAIIQLTRIVIALAWVNGLLMVLYLVAPSGEQIAKMAATVAAMRSGGGYSSSAYAETDDGTSLEQHTEITSAPAGGDEGDVDLSGSMKPKD